MRKSLIVLLSVLALVLGFTTIATAAAKPAYKVSLTAPKSSQAGKFVIVSGKVTGPKAAGKTVKLQRKFAGGPWVNVAFPVIKGNGKFSARVETPRGGTTSFRALKAGSSVRKAGASPVRALPVYKWIYLTRESPIASNNDVDSGITQTIAGTSYPNSVRASEGDSVLRYKTSNLCTTFTTRVAYDVTNGPQPVDVFTLRLEAQKQDAPPVENDVDVQVLQNKTATLSLKGAKWLRIELDSLNSSPYFAVLGDPKVYCNAEQLPSWVPSDYI